MKRSKTVISFTLPALLILVVIMLFIMQIHFTVEQCRAEFRYLMDEVRRNTTETAFMIGDEMLLLPVLVKMSERNDSPKITYEQVLSNVTSAIKFWNKHAIIPSLFSNLYLYAKTGESEDKTVHLLHWEQTEFTDTNIAQKRAVTSVMESVLKSKPENTGLWYISSPEVGDLIVSPIIAPFSNYFLIVEVDMTVLSSKLIPILTAKFFTENSSYRIRIYNETSDNLIYTNEKAYNPAHFASPDYSYRLFDGEPHKNAIFSRISPSWDLPIELFSLNQEDEIAILRNHMRTKAAFNENLSSGIKPFPYNLTLEVVHKDGSVLSAAKKTAAFNMGISLSAFIILTVGIGILQRNMAKAQKLANHQQEFIASVTHELKTPLTVIVSSAQNMADGIIKEPEKIKKYGKMICTESQKLKNTIDYFLLYAKMNTASSLPCRECRLGEMLQSTVSLLAPAAQEVQMDITIDIPPKEITVSCDETAIRSVFRNIAENAIKHAASGRYLHISVSAEKEFAVIRFADKGPGVPRKEFKRIFDAFQRGSSAVEHQTEGSGIGLNLARRIVTLHGGSLMLESTSPHGSVFAVRIPLKNAAI